MTAEEYGRELAHREPRITQATAEAAARILLSAEQLSEAA